MLGEPYRTLARPLARVGAALETTGFHPGRSARAHLEIACLQGGLDRGRAGAVLSLTGMGEFADMKVRGYSLGMKQRLAFATALLGEPTVLVLDEPANGLDPAGVAWLRGFLRRFADDGGAVLVSSHLLSEVAEVADRVVVIDRGALVADDTVDRLVGAGGETVVVRSPERDRLRTVVETAGGRGARPGRRRARASDSSRSSVWASSRAPRGSSCTSCVGRPPPSRTRSWRSPARRLRPAGSPRARRRCARTSTTGPHRDPLGAGGGAQGPLDATVDRARARWSRPHRPRDPAAAVAREHRPRPAVGPAPGRDGRGPAPSRLRRGRRAGLRARARDDDGHLGVPLRDGGRDLSGHAVARCVS